MENRTRGTDGARWPCLVHRRCLLAYSAALRASRKGLLAQERNTMVVRRWAVLTMIGRAKRDSLDSYVANRACRGLLSEPLPTGSPLSSPVTPFLLTLSCSFIFHALHIFLLFCLRTTTITLHTPFPTYQPFTNTCTICRANPNLMGFYSGFGYQPGVYYASPPENPCQPESVFSFLF